jgi:hypothetical protein
MDFEAESPVKTTHPHPIMGIEQKISTGRYVFAMLMPCCLQPPGWLGCIDGSDALLFPQTVIEMNAVQLASAAEADACLARRF